MTATRALGFQFTAPLTQGFDTFGTHSAKSSSVVGSLPLGQSVSQPLLAFGPSPVLYFGLPTDGTPDEQYQHVMELVQALQGMALTIRPLVIPTTPEIPQQPFSVFQAHSTAPPPRPSPQLLTTPVMGATSVPSAQTPLSAQFPPLVYGG